MSVIATGVDSENEEILILEVSEKDTFEEPATFEGDGPHTNVKKGDSIKSTSGREILEVIDFKTTDSGTKIVFVKIYSDAFDEFSFRGYILAGEQVQSWKGDIGVSLNGIDIINNNIDSFEILNR